AAASAVIFYQRQMETLNAVSVATARNTGMSAKALDEAARAGAKAAGITNSAAREMAGELAKTGKIGGEMFSDLIGMSRDYAAATGQDAKAATRELGKAFSDPIKGAQSLGVELGVIDAATYRYIQSLVEQNRVTDA